MVIFNSYVKLPEGIYIYIHIYISTEPHHKHFIIHSPSNDVESLGGHPLLAWQQPWQPWQQSNRSPTWSWKDHMRERPI